MKLRVQELLSLDGYVIHSVLTVDGNVPCFVDIENIAINEVAADQ